MCNRAKSIAEVIQAIILAGMNNYIEVYIGQSPSSSTM